jgi:hypothetical protein
MSLSITGDPRLTVPTPTDKLHEATPGLAPMRFPRNDLAMFRWPEKLATVILAYGLVFVGFPVLCYVSYLWVTGAF